ncbi:MAG: hypothetical protein RJB31_546 [Bacteroidota bacterium]
MLLELVHAQQKAAATDDQYLKVLESRVTKILAPLNIEKIRKQSKVHQIVLTQYQTLNTIHTTRDLKIKELKSGNAANANELKKVIADLESAAGQEIAAVHSTFLHDLRRHLTDAQVDALKDGMTYNVANITFKGYQDMLPALNDSQKTKIWNWLAEAREIAMDAETSEKKHWWFGKYKGRINNYLSSEGFDMKKESEAWQKRIKSASPINTTKNS